MPGPQSNAITTAIACVSGPALILDVGRSALLGANRAAGEDFIGGRPTLALPLALDSAMPALVDLRLALAADGSLRNVAHGLALTFWTAQGARCVWSRVQLVAGAEPGIVLVQFPPDPEPGEHLLAGLVQSGRELRHLAHELRTPLAAILSLADVLHGGHLGVIANARHRDYLASMRETARHALDVIEAMLERPSGWSDVVPPAAGLDLTAAVAEVVAGMSALAVRTGARLLMAASTGLPLVAADGTAVRQMLINLIANSLAHAGGGVTVTIATGCGAGRDVWVDVADSGPGIPAAIVERLRTGLPPDTAPDNSVRPQLGLSLTQSLARDNGGRLELTSSPEGARARLIFAAYQPPGGNQVVASSSG